MPDTNFTVGVLAGTDPSISIISVKGALVLENIFRFQDAWRSNVSEKLIFDLSAVPYMDSSAIGSLVNAHVSCVNRGRKMVLVGVNDRIKQILSATHVSSLFQFSPDVESAESAIGASAGN
jgi:anti-sigma B factor antagonist